MSEESTRPIQVVSPITGELFELDRPSIDLARLLQDVRDAESMLREAKRVVGDELLRRMDQAASWTIRLEGGLTVKSSSPAAVEQFDAPELHDDLMALVDEGVLTVEAADAAVETVVSYKARKVGINALRKLGGRVAEIVNAHARSEEPTRYVSVTRT